MFDKTAFAKRLRELREAKGWTQKEAADKCGIVCSTYSAYENKKNTKSPLLEVAVKMAEGYGISMNELCGMEVKPPEAPKAVEPPAEDHVYSCAEIARLLMELAENGIITEIHAGDGVDYSGAFVHGVSTFIYSQSLFVFFQDQNTLENLQSPNKDTIYESWEEGALNKLESIYMHGDGKEDENPR